MPVNGFAGPVMPGDKYDWLNGLGEGPGPGPPILKLGCCCWKGLEAPIPTLPTELILPIPGPPLAKGNALGPVVC